MKVTINYKAISPFYSDLKIDFIGVDTCDLINQIYDFEDYLGKESNGYKNIYKKEVVSGKENLVLHECDIDRIFE